MSNTNENGIKTPLGVMGILSESFSIFSSNFFFFVGTALVMQLLSFGLTFLIYGGQIPNFTDSSTTFMSGETGVLLILSTLLSFIGITLVASVISLAAFDVKTNTPLRIGFYVRRAINTIVPLMVLMIVTMIVVGIPIGIIVAIGGIFPATLFLAIPLGLFLVLYIYGVFSVTSPSIVIEGTSFRGMSRSMELTSGYRAKIIGLYFIIFFGIFLFMILMGIVTAFVFPTGAASAFSISLSGQIFNQVLSSIMVAFFSVVVVMLFARLKEIKEGYGFENIGDVFD